MGWISVKDKLPQGQWAVTLPQCSEEVLIANSCAVDIGFYNRDNGRWYAGCPAEDDGIDKITHWMPLPQNPHDLG